MIVTYEFNIDGESDDKYELDAFQISKNMYMSLSDISEYIREIRKGWKNPDVDEMVDYIQELINESKIHELE
jgi:hypothetical protein